MRDEYLAYYEIKITVHTQSTTLCQCQVPLVQKCRARLMQASAPGSRMDRSPYEGRLCPEEQKHNDRHKPDRRQSLLRGPILTFTASKIRIALAKSFNLRQALSAASRIFGSGTRSYPIKVFIPETQVNLFYFGRNCFFK